MCIDGPAYPPDPLPREGRGNAEAALPIGLVMVGDCLEVMRGWPDASFDHCIADPPFNISGHNTSKKRGLGWAFSSHVTMQEGWDQFTPDAFYQFNLAWLREACRVLKPNGNLLVFGTYHNIYLLGYLLQHVLDRRINNSIIWFKSNAQPNITARSLTESTEQIIWAVNGQTARAHHWTFDYWRAKELAGGKQMRNLWEFPVTPRSERRLGRHPSQKPLALLERILEIATAPGDLLLDPFGGAGTLALAAERMGRRWILIESVSEYADLARRRLQALQGRLTVQGP